MIQQTSHLDCRPAKQVPAAETGAMVMPTCKARVVSPPSNGSSGGVA
jgi:hypothetical protein